MLCYVKSDFEIFCLIVLNKSVFSGSAHTVTIHSTQTATNLDLGTEMAKWLRCERGVLVVSYVVNRTL